jgi:DNA-binding transcriptional MerR regulator
MLPAVTDSDLTIDELAQRAGTTVRTIRAYRERGLLPPPRMRGRTGLFGAGHLQRLRLITEMQREGFNLEAIRRLLELGATGGGDQLRQLIARPFEEEPPELLSVDDLRRRFGAEVDAEVLARARRLGLVRVRDDGQIEVTAPALMRAGEEVLALGVPLDAALEVVESLVKHSAAVAHLFIRLFVTHILQPFEDDASRVEERLPELADAVERLRPLATDALVAVFQRTMTRALEHVGEVPLDDLVQQAPDPLGRS